MGLFAAELAARVGAFQSEVERALAGWERERRARWDAVSGRIHALTVQIIAAQDECRRRLATTPTPRRGQVPEVFRWVGRFDRERGRIEEQVWAILRTGRAEDARWRARVGARAEELRELGRRLYREAHAAVAEATAAGTVRVADTPAGRALAAELGRGLDALASELAARRAGIERDLGGLAGRAFPDLGAALERFDAAMAGRLTGAAAPAARPQRAAARRAPPRKKAKVPQFLIKRFYKPGGLRAVADGVEITFTNPLAFCIVQGGDAVVVDGRAHPKAQTALDNGERRLGGDELSEQRYLKFAKGGEIRVTLRGLALSPGPHRFVCWLEMRKMGWVELIVEDRL